MPPALPPYWVLPQTIAEARTAQMEMAARLVTEDALPSAVQRIGAADVSNTRFDPRRMIHAALVTLSPRGDILARATDSSVARFPYIPGYLGFREVPGLLACWARLDPKPDVILVDGHGLAHPRGMGIATQLGIVLGVPTIGVAKSLLVGEAALGPEVGSRAPLLWHDRQIGMALRTRRGARPVFVSVGHRVSLETAVKIVLGTCDGRRLPVPIRAAHLTANEARRGAGSAAPSGPPPEA